MDRGGGREGGAKLNGVKSFKKYEAGNVNIIDFIKAYNLTFNKYDFLNALKMKILNFFIVKKAQFLCLSFNIHKKALNKI